MNFTIFLSLEEFVQENVNPTIHQNFLFSLSTFAALIWHDHYYFLLII